MTSEHFQHYLTLERRLLEIQEKFPNALIHSNFYEEQDISQELEHLWYELSDEEREEVVKNHHKRIGKFCEETEKVEKRSRRREQLEAEGVPFYDGDYSV